MGWLNSRSVLYTFCLRSTCHPICLKYPGLTSKPSHRTKLTLVKKTGQTLSAKTHQDGKFPSLW